MKFVPLLLLLAAPSCAATSGDYSPPQTSGQLERAAAEQGIFPELRPTRVTFVDHSSGLKIGLLNNSAVDKSDYYSQQRKTADYKVIPDLDMGALIAQFKALGFFTSASTSSRRVRGARRTIQVEQDGQYFTLAYISGGTKDQYDQALNCSLAVQSLYNAHDSYQRVDNQSGPGFFKEGKQDIFNQ